MGIQEVDNNAMSQHLHDENSKFEKYNLLVALGVNVQLVNSGTDIINNE